jgi:hypothetical protein
MVASFSFLEVNLRVNLGLSLSSTRAEEAQTAVGPADSVPQRTRWRRFTALSAVFERHMLFLWERRVPQIAELLDQAIYRYLSTRVVYDLKVRAAGLGGPGHRLASNVSPCGTSW